MAGASDAFRSLASPRSMRILLLVGLALAAWSGWQWREEALLIERARPVPAEVLEVDVVDSVAGTGQARERSWRPVVRYRYTLDGRVLVSDRVTPLGKGGSRAWAQEIAAGFQVGERVTAHVDPGDPERSFLLPVRSWKEPVGTVGGLLIAAACGYGLLRRRRRD